MNVFNCLANQMTLKQDRTFAIIGQQLQSNCTVSFIFTFHLLVITSRISSVRGWLKIAIACAFDSLCNCFGFAFRQSFENRSKTQKLIAVKKSNQKIDDIS